MRQNRPLILIFITLLIDIIGIGIIIPIIPDLLKQMMNADMSTASKIGGYLVFAYAGAQFLCAPLFGALSDRFGRRPILLISLAGLGIDYVFHALAPTVELLFVGRVLAGVCGASFTTATAYLADISKPEERAQNFGMIGVAFGLGFILGPLIGGLVGEWGLRVPFWVAAGLSLGNTAFCYFLLPESLPAESRRAFHWKYTNPFGTLKHLRKYTVAIGLMPALILLYLAAHAVQSNWSYYVMYKFHWTKALVGISLSVVGLSVAIVQGGLIRKVVPKFGERKSIIGGLIFYGAGMLFFALSNHSWMMYASIVVYCLGGIGGPTMQGLMSRQVPINQQGELNGILTSMMALTSIIGPLLMNNLFGYFTGPDAPVKLPEAPMLLGTIFIGLAVILSLKPLKRFLKPDEQQQVTEPDVPAVGH